MTEPTKPTKAYSVQFLNPQTLHPYYRNNKAHNKRQITLLARVLRTHGFDQPIVVDKDLVIIKGHGRWQAALEAKYTMIPVVIRDDLEEWEVQASRIADNQAFAISEIDGEKSRAEVDAYVKEGGVGAEFYFDFLRPPTKKSETPASSIHQVSAHESVAGKLVTCPKCNHTQMEL